MLLKKLLIVLAVASATACSHTDLIKIHNTAVGIQTLSKPGYLAAEIRTQIARETQP
jgi:hypothetical protein